MRAASGCACVAAAALALAAAGGALAAGPPRVPVMVAYPNGQVRETTVVAAQTTVAVRGKHCAVPAGTALAALAHAGAGVLSLHDYGACSARPADAAGLFVAAIGGVRNRGRNGWVYKVGERAATSGAADPAGPFGHGPLRAGARVTWFYCHMSARLGGCQPTLAVGVRVLGGGVVAVRVRAFDDRGRTRRVGRATVHAGARLARADAHGHARLRLAPGAEALYATAPGAVRSPEAVVQVR